MAEIDDAVRSAMDELYSHDPDTFMERRAALAAAAKKDGNAQAGKQISALRKPTRSAYVVNFLARSEPDRIAELVELGDQLRRAERSVDARQIRDLTSRRRRLVNDLTRRAFESVDDGAPSSAVRDEVVSTLTAALADPDVAAQVADGTLVKPARWEGFGFGGSPDLTVVGGTGGAGGGSGARGSSGPASGAKSSAPSAPASRRASVKGLSQQDRVRARREAEEQEAERKAQEKAAAQEARQARITDARQAADDAEEAYLIAADEEQSRVDRLRELEEQVADARRAVDEARIQLRRAEIRQRRARDALARLEH